MGPSSEPHTLERAGCRLHYWLAGPESAPLVALAHGMALDHRMFDAQVDALAGSYRVLTWDMRGHGRSQPLGRRFSVPLLVDDLLALLARVGRQRAVVVGHSLGGIVAQELAFRHPPRVAGLVAYGCTCVTLSAPPAQRAATRLAAPLMRLVRLAPYWPMARLNARQMAARPDARAYAVDMAARLPRETFFAALEALATARHPEPAYRFTRPLLLVVGGRDPFGSPAAGMRAWAARDRQAEVLTLPEAGHNANQDSPEAFNAALLRFLAQAAPR